MKRSAWYGVLALLAAAPLQALAADGYVTGDVTLRAGPDIDYPAVDMIPAGAPIAIEGCTDGWEWCDVVFDDERGWVAGNFIQDEYGEQPVLVPAYGERLGIPIVSFSIVTYWDHYYVGRPFYHERERWYHRPPPHHAPPPPSHRPWSHPRREDHRVDRDHDGEHAAPAPYRRAEPKPRQGHAPPYVPADRHPGNEHPAAPPLGAHPQRPATPGPPTPPRGAAVGHPATGHRTDAQHDNTRPSSSHGKDDQRGH